MTSVKCPQCGLVNWSTAANCKRCGLAVADGFADPGMDHQQSYAPPAPAQPIPGPFFDEDELLHKLKRDSHLFYVIGGLQILLWFFVGNFLIVDGVLNIGLSYLARKFRSRIAASLLVVLTLFSVLAALVALATGALRFNLLTPVVLIGRIVASVRMVYCTFKLNANVTVEVKHLMPPLPPAFHNEEQSQWAQPAGPAQWQPE
jgi:hypothetical protein